MDSPRSWVPASEASDHGTNGAIGVQHEDNCQAGAGTDNGRRGAGTDQFDSHNNQEAAPGIEHRISPCVPCLETALVAAMTDGSYLLMAYRQREPTAFVARDDVALLRQALAEAFGNSMEGAGGGNGDGTRTGAMCCTAGRDFGRDTWCTQSDRPTVRTHITTSARNVGQSTGATSHPLERGTSAA